MAVSATGKVDPYDRSSPHPDEEHVRALVEDVVVYVRNHVVLTSDHAQAVALWVLHTHTADALGITPYLAITSAEKGCGKTRLLEVLALLVARPWLTGSVSAATLVRKIDTAKPTLLLDESDAAFRSDGEYAEALRGVLDTGFMANGVYSRCVGAGSLNFTVEDFSTFCPKAIAGIGRLPDTVASRSIHIRLQRKTAQETVQRFRQLRARDESAPLRQRIEEWAELSFDRLAALELDPLEELSDRAADIWEPLLGIASLAGQRSYADTCSAAVALSGNAVDRDDSNSIRLLSDLRDLFAQAGLDAISSEDAVRELAAIEDAPWAEWFGRPLTKNGLAKILRAHEIRPRTIRLGARTAKGYTRDQFADTWARYLPPSGSPAPQANVTPSQINSPTDGASSAIRDGEPHVTAVTPEKGDEAQVLWRHPHPPTPPAALPAGAADWIRELASQGVPVQDIVAASRLSDGRFVLTRELVEDVIRAAH